MGFAENLALLQKQHNETNYRLAKAIGVHQTSIANWKERGIKPHPKHVKLVADHYGVTVADIEDAVRCTAEGRKKENEKSY